MLKSFALAVRRLRRQPSFALAAIATIALGIGAATAIFSALNAALIRPLPYPHPDDLYTLRTRHTDGRFTSGLVASLELSRLREAAPDRVLATAFSYESESGVTWLDGSEAVRLAAHGVSRGFFDVFGLPMALGRGFTDDEHALKAPRTVVLSHGLWQSLFGGSPAVLGTSLRLSEGSWTVVGVAHAAFDVPSDADLWFNLRDELSIGHIYNGYMRLRPGTTPAALQGQMTSVMEALGREFPDQNQNRAFVVERMLAAVVGDLGPILVIVFGAAVLLLVLAGANVTNLLLARGTGRAREIAVQAALGASRRRLIADLLGESLALTVIGGAVGVALAYFAIRGLALAGLAGLPRLSALTFETNVALFAVAAMLVTGVAVGVLPAASLVRTDLRSLANASGRSATSSRTARRLLGALVVVEIAVAITLLSGAGRVVQRFSDLFAIDPGFTTEERLIVDVVLPPWRPAADAARFDTWTAEVRDRLRPLGVTAMAATSTVPLAREWDTTIFVDFVGVPAPEPHARPNARVRMVSPELFGVLGMRLVAGRGFTAADRPGAPGAIVVNEAFVRRFLAPADPVGRRVVLPGFRGRREGNRWIFEEATIVGVVADAKYASLATPAEQTVYVSMAELPQQRQSLVLTAGSSAPRDLAPAVRRVLKEVAANVPVEIMPFSEIVARSVSRQRLGMILMLVFGVAALVLAMVGVFGVIAYGAAQRRSEMAVRLALGGDAAHVFWLVLREGARLALLGAFAGLASSWWTGRVMSHYMSARGSGDAAILASSTLIVLALALVSAAVVACRAARTDPAGVLQSA